MNNLQNTGERKIRQNRIFFSIFSGKTELFLRVVFGLPLAGLVLFVTWVGGFAFHLFASFFATAMFFEYCRICKRDIPLSIVAFSWILFFSGLVTWLIQAYDLSVVLVGAGFLFLLVWEIMIRQTGWMASGFLYAFLPFCALVSLRGEGSEGGYTVALLFIFVWSVDTMAYMTGKAFSGPKLAPEISPGKTWSGFFGGIIGGILTGWCTIRISGYCTVWLFWPVFLVLAIFSQVGDLAESALKRKFNVKDSSNIIPGHGGVLDRIDGFVFVVVATWIMVLVVSGSSFDEWVKKSASSFLSSMIAGECGV